jgi:hypothetical protein
MTNYLSVETYERLILLIVMSIMCPLTTLCEELSASAQSIIPVPVQQIVSIDYMRLRDLSPAQSLKAHLFPEIFQRFDIQLRELGIDTDYDINSLTFATYRGAAQQANMIVVVEGVFSEDRILEHLLRKKIHPQWYGGAALYGISGDIEMTLVDGSTLLFGNLAAIEGALDTLTGLTPSLPTDTSMCEMMEAVNSAPVWSILDAAGTRNMVQSALEKAAQILDISAIDRSLVGCGYSLNFSAAANFDVEVHTSDLMLASVVANLIKVGIHLRMNSKTSEKPFLNNVNVETNGSNVQIHFSVDTERLEFVLDSDLFAALSR